ncbi:KEOPS complex subunit Pcc1 [Halorubrum vacuolatum]|uniref:KEOPS complex subunit Pcc1 n=1 Tax=Halorubrum vacuolatum TaxID=63740 RepID=A0A238W637_HALVU|nr:KEOPS complex subunit Pcc1 [Halorubrum vacuolatum]SNR41774.1 KEOPS complex subunit Pcc1 [Halorubrum vacuolatum]
MSTDPSTREHTAALRFRYPDEPRARVVGAALAPEVGEIDDDRSAATVERDGRDVVVHVGADDLVALRAGINSWSRLVAVAETVAEGPGNGHAGTGSRNDTR